MNEHITHALQMEQAGRWEDSMTLLESVLATSIGEDKFDALLQIGKLKKYIGDFKGAQDVFKRLLSDLIKSGEYDRLREVKLQLAIVWQYLGKYCKFEKTIRGLLTESIDRDDKYVSSHCLMQIGIFKRILRQLDEAEVKLTECREQKHTLGLLRDEAAAIEQLGIIEERRSNFSAAKKLYEESFQLKKKIGYQRGIVTSYLRFGVLLRKQGLTSEALKLLKDTLKMRSEMDDSIGLASSHFQVGKCYASIGSFEDAEMHLHISRKIRQKNGDIRRLSNSLAEHGVALTKLGKLNEGVRELRMAEKLQNLLRLRAEQYQSLKYLLNVTTISDQKLLISSKLKQLELESVMLRK